MRTGERHKYETTQGQRRERTGEKNKQKTLL